MNTHAQRRRPLVVLVDDEDNIVHAMHRVLYQDNHIYGVMIAKTAETAQEILRSYRVDVLVTDVQLPGMSGMDLLCWAAVESPATRVIVMTAFDVAGIQDRANTFGCLQLTRKPFDVHAMRSTINQALQGHGLTGSLADLSVVDVIQMLCICRKTTTLRISEAESSGFVVIESGEIVHAVWNDLSGELAFYEMMSVTSGIFNTVPLPIDLKRTITSGWQQLLLEGTRRQDEAGRRQLDSVNTSESSRLDRSPKPGRVTKPEAPSESVDVLIDRGFKALRAGNHEEALKCWEAGLLADPGNRMLDLNLRRLHAKLAALTEP